MSQKPPMLDPAVLAVLEAARTLTRPPAAVRSRMLSALEIRIDALPTGGGTDDDDDDDDGGNDGDGDDGGDGSGSVGAGGGSVGAGGGSVGGGGGAGAWLSMHPFLALGAVFAIGGVVGALVREAALPPPRVVYVDRAVAASPVRTISSQRAETAASAVSVELLPAAPALSARVAPAPAPADSGEYLRAENALLDTARGAIARGEAEQALVAINRHEERFRDGLLREEREVLAIKALRLVGRGAEAASRAARFRERYPTSVFLDSASSGIPR